ncbi:MAG: hypothetical protein HY661_10400 [Betaproteobacteria bacterium]|nr:hypothetical protein [Betaproteobacteria bacterium]
MNVHRNFLTAVLFCTGLGVGAAGAADNSWLFQKGFFGTPSQGKPEVTIKVSGATGNIWVDHFATAKIENDKGANFLWRFDGTTGVSNFPLKTIAPRGFDAGSTQVIVMHPSQHLSP